MSYCINLIADPASPGFGKMLNSIHEIKTFTLNDINIIATLFVLFGHTNKSIYLITHSNKSGHKEDVAKIIQEENYIVKEQTLMRATARPIPSKINSPFTKRGVYVLRWFNIDMKHVDEIAELSNGAWPYFENDDIEVQALLAETTDEKDGKMLLITQYKNFMIWENSRKNQDERSSSRFRKRNELMKSAIPFATKLYLPPKTANM